MGMADSDFTKRLHGWSLSTIDIIYYMPDHPDLLQRFSWQTLDIAPRYPRLNQFLDFWRREIEAVIHSIRIGSGESLAPAQWRAVREFSLD